MQELFSLFPPTDMTLLAFIVLLPLIGAIVNGLFGKRLGKEAVTLMGLSAIAGSFVLALVCFGALLGAPEGQTVKLAWRGWAARPIYEQPSPEESEKNIREAVAAILERYPPKPGEKR